jgi:hypothetical protein
MAENREATKSLFVETRKFPRGDITKSREIRKLGCLLRNYIKIKEPKRIKLTKKLGKEDEW